MVRLSKKTVLTSITDKKYAPFVVSKSINTSHNIEIALQETKSLALIKNKRNKPSFGFKICQKEFENSYNSKKCLSTDEKELKQIILIESDEALITYSCQEKSYKCPFLTPLKLKKREVYSENENGMLLQQNRYLNGDDWNILDTISSPRPIEKGVFETANNPCNLEKVWAEFMYNFEDEALINSKLCSCILRKQKKLRTKSMEDNFQECSSIGSSLVSVPALDRYWKIKEIYKRASFNERKHTGIDKYEETRARDLPQDLLNHSKSEQLKRCMCEIKQLHDSLKNKM
ncbi:uncharacterized protein LOC111058076 [Nilaparvata lugens]|uniref:uncharacterized protein LOC111058076 n=1 Tax=Nilaparvata lugens TaxID=108931 RepID=UPI00193D4247|nr:uncharacterized protein LOC111058076 [Nilaparvata lugens]